MHFSGQCVCFEKCEKPSGISDFFEFILMMQMSKEQRVTAKNQFTFEENGIVERIISKLPYPLTGAQKRTIDVFITKCVEIVMQLLIQGDVGSGKTIVAFLATIDAASNGYQSAIMAPTEVLLQDSTMRILHRCLDYDLDFPAIPADRLHDGKSRKGMPTKGCCYIQTHRSSEHML